MGAIIIPPYPTLQAGVQSDLLKITSATPDQKLEIVPVSLQGGVEFTPKAVEIINPQAHAHFRVSAKKAGAYRIQYLLSGPDKINFLTPEDGLLIVSEAEKQENLKTIPDESFAKYQCRKYTLDKCVTTSHDIGLVSSCPWVSDGSFGYQSTIINNLKLPLSLSGLNSTIENKHERAYKKDGVLTVYQETLDVMKSGIKQCPKTDVIAALNCQVETPFGTAEHKFIIECNLFARAYLRVVSTVTPWWYNLELPYDYEGFHVNDIQSLVIKGQAAEKLVLCPRIPKFSNNIYSVFTPKARLALSLLSMKSTIQNKEPSCVGMDLCNGVHYFSVGGKGRIDLSPSITSAGVTNMRMGLYSLGFLGDKTKEEHCAKKFDYVGKQWSQACLKPNLWAMVGGSILLNNVNISYNGETFVESSDEEQVSIKARPHDAISCTQLLSNSLIRKLSLWFQLKSAKESYDTYRIVCTGLKRRLKAYRLTKAYFHLGRNWSQRSRETMN